MSRISNSQRIAAMLCAAILTTTTVAAAAAPAEAADARVVSASIDRAPGQVRG